MFSSFLGLKPNSGDEITSRFSSLFLNNFGSSDGERLPQNGGEIEQGNGLEVNDVGLSQNGERDLEGNGDSSSFEIHAFWEVLFSNNLTLLG